MTTLVSSPNQEKQVLVAESRGAVFTKTWVVDLILDLAGYVSSKNLVDSLAIEPASGEGAFLLSIINRLVASCRKQERTITDCSTSLIAYEIDEETAQKSKKSIIQALFSLNVSQNDAEYLAEEWVHVGDYLIDAPFLPKADFVIGNPPYVRLENIPVTVADLYRSMYPTMKGRADMYVGFYEAALKQLKTNGTCAYICADRWMLNQYGAELRRFIANNFSVDVVIEMHNADAFEDEVSAYPAITIIKNKKQNKAVVASIGPSIEVTGSTFQGAMTNATSGFNIATIENWFKDDSPWPCSSPQRLKVLRRLERDFSPLESSNTKTRVGIGIATGLDSVFITKNSDAVEKERLLPLAMASDTLNGHIEWSGHYLVNPWNASGLVELSQYSQLNSYFATHEVAIKKRHTAEKNPLTWYRTIDRVNHKLTNQPKIYIPDIKNKINPVLDDGKTYPHHNLYFIVSDIWDLEVLGGVLMSAIGQFFVECYGVRMRGGYLRFQAQYLRRIRVPNPNSITSNQQKILKSAFRTRDLKLANEVVYQIYRLEKNEIKVMNAL